jgi:hypothetical protein
MQIRTKRHSLPHRRFNEQQSARLSQRLNLTIPPTKRSKNIQDRFDNVITLTRPWRSFSNRSGQDGENRHVAIISVDSYCKMSTGTGVIKRRKTNISPEQCLDVGDVDIGVMLVL